MKQRGIQLMAALIAIALGGCNRSAAGPSPSPYANAEQIEMNFRGQSFSLGNNDKVAILTPAGGPRGGPNVRALKLPFWLGTNILVPGVLQPKDGDYYVISEAVLVKTLGNPDEWLIEAGSSLIKKETVLVTTRTRFRLAGQAPPEALPKVLPMIVQFAGTRPFKRGDGTTIEIAVLKEVSLPMKWTLAGAIPASYARFQVR